ncbi:GntR family transcriptional regulator [Anaerotignum propionicum]|jgi:DNA-binding GntR family transcriptional regulator|uniref:HTH-type transcriptional regulator McbR n=1 Tax=Anaerotignum propionicum DSM 1682 TaxID=991789 RepID=A0A110A7J1_ANAPI|nr:GntR family transcriptional regulator [Anaerotignum propionicum]AMJ42305.1 HTH-type transcriptional regulator McbR [Anaerotignum propionicum DSM 1682]MEA5056777.1 GntR family transcriptional regulator [Anaerotignum propionicum]SHE55973.1 transcriptional regulator, GntR family [[Clostridium] propionicum DSM 1682] [Anaerotignum propionicum DSM 1682]
MEETKFNINTNEYLPLRDVVFHTLREAILVGKLVPGERLMENQLADKLGVSRTPVREALRMLALENLVELVPRKGAQVLDMSEKDIVNILEVRGALESLATSIACVKMKKEDLQQLKKLEGEFERAIDENDLERIIQLDEDFHDLILKSTENDKLAQIYQNLRIQLYRYRMAHLKADSSIPAVVAHHRGILRAIENHDADEGATVAHGHIKYHTEFILRSIRNK